MNRIEISGSGEDLLADLKQPIKSWWGLCQRGDPSK